MEEIRNQYSCCHHPIKSFQIPGFERQVPEQRKVRALLGGGQDRCPWGKLQELRGSLEGLAKSG
ncbi:MAG TPA: hypothetical protein PKO06_14110, partial [Candidatus Ozemobacteraceae bacterium]|nr:hypothetical protein [Candidatus Ozemobacteraceae bacterium]